MKFTIVFTTLLCVSTSWAVLAKKIEEPKDKREAAVGYGSALSSQSYQAPLGHGDASAISVGAGYSIGGAKPSYSFGGQGYSALQNPSEGLSTGGHSTLQLAPITLQPNQFASGDFSQIMSQLSHSLNGGGLSLQPSTTVAEFHQTGNEGGQAVQEVSLPQYQYAAPNLQQYTQQYALPESLSNAPSYTVGTKGLGSYSTGPVLFNPESQSGAAGLTYNTQGSGQSLGDASGLSFGGASHGLSGLSFGGAGASLGGAYKQLGASYLAPSKNTFKPSAFLGSSLQGESGHGGSSLTGSYSAPSFGGFRGGSHGGLSFASAGGHGANFGGLSGLSGGLSGFGGGSSSFGGGSSGFGGGAIKYAAPSFQSSKGEGFGSALEGLSSLSSSHLSSPPGATYGFPSASYTSNNAHAASSTRPYYVSTKHHHSSPSFGEGSSAYRSPASGHSSLSSFSSGPKYSFGGSSSHHSPKDTQGAYSETSYNTIKYSEELKPRVH